MGRGNATKNQLIELAEPVCAGAGYELVDVHYSREQHGWVVRVLIDRLAEHGAAIGFADCERVSRELSVVLDVEDPVPHAYRLEVSSPGIDRPLRTPKHFRRHVGEIAKITMEPSAASELEGRRNFRGTLVAVEGNEDDAEVAIEVDGVTYRLPVCGIATAKLVPDWDALFGKAEAPARASRE
jgi:ribosome maturation factor RimP